jgi:hypothetical protein
MFNVKAIDNIAQGKECDSNSLSIVTSERPSWETPLKIPDGSDTEEGQGAKPLAQTQKELLNLHNALIREAKLQGIAKYQVRTL